jgi:formate dehydrogenase major subunit
MAEIAALTPTFAGVSFERLDELGSIQWPCNADHPAGTPVMHVDTFTRGLGRFVPTPYVPTDERATRRFPLLLTTGRILSQYNVGAQTRRTANIQWQGEDLLEIHEADAGVRGIEDGTWVELSSRVGSTAMRARITERVPPGVVYTTFHFPVSGANVVTTEYSDWATNCPEYKVTAVEVRPTLRAGGPASAEHLGLQPAEPQDPQGAAALVRMAEQIAANHGYLGAAQAAEAVGRHLDRYWTTEMLAGLADHLATHPGSLSEVVQAALRRRPPPPTVS